MCYNICKFISEKFQNKYRIPSARLLDWDYGWNAAYFVIICTKNREHYFGKIVNDEICLSEIGKIANDEWLKTFEIRTDMNLTMGEFVVMPNHFHCIIIMGENEYNRSDEFRRDAMHGVSTLTIIQSCNKIGPQRKKLSSIIRGFTSAVTIQFRKINSQFEWQSRFYDQIIRNDESFDNIHKYIINNPKNWKADKFFGIENKQT